MSLEPDWYQQKQRRKSVKPGSREEREIDAGPRPAEQQGYTLYARRNRNRFGESTVWIYRRRSR